MTVATRQAAKYTTVADLVRDLGDVPSWRVRLVPPPGQATVQDVIDLDAHAGRLFELVDGVLVERPKSYFESRLAIVLATLLELFSGEHGLGAVAGADGMMRLGVRLVRIPDVSFVAWDHFPGGQLPHKPVPEVAPDLAVEILSESNTPAEMRRKLREYFGAGTRLVWIIDPPTRTARVYTSPETPVELDEAGHLDGGDVLPGFNLRLGELFERAERRTPQTPRP